MSLIQLDNFTAGKDGGTVEGGVLVTQDRMTDTDASKVDANAKSDAPNASDGSKIGAPKIHVKRGIVRPCSVAIVLSRNVSLIQKFIRDAQSDGEGTDTGKFDVSIDTKKEAKKRQQKEATKSRRETKI